MVQKMASLCLTACSFSVLNKIQKIANYNLHVEVIQNHGFVLQT